MGFRERGPELECLAERALGLAVAAQCQQRGTPDRVRFRKRGVERNGPVVGLDGARQIADQPTAVPQMQVPRLGCGPEQDGTFKRGPGPAQVTVRLPRQAQIDGEVGRPRVQGTRPFQQRDGPAVVAGLMGEDSREVETIRLIRVERQDILVAGQRPSPLAGLMMGQAPSQQLPEIPGQLRGA